MCLSGSNGVSAAKSPKKGGRAATEAFAVLDAGSAAISQFSQPQTRLEAPGTPQLTSVQTTRPRTPLTMSTERDGNNDPSDLRPMSFLRFPSSLQKRGFSALSSKTRWPFIPTAAQEAQTGDKLAAPFRCTSAATPTASRRPATPRGARVKKCACARVAMSLRGKHQTSTEDYNAAQRRVLTRWCNLSLATRDQQVCERRVAPCGQPPCRVMPVPTRARSVFSEDTL